MFSFPPQDVCETRQVPSVTWKLYFLPSLQEGVRLWMYIQSIGRSIITPTDRDNNVLTDRASGAHKLFFLSCLSKDLRDRGGWVVTASEALQWLVISLLMLLACSIFPVPPVATNSCWQLTSFSICCSLSAWRLWLHVVMKPCQLSPLLMRQCCELLRKTPAASGLCLLCYLHSQAIYCKMLPLSGTE